MATTMTEIPIKDLALTTAPAGKQSLVRDASAGLQRIDYDQIAKNLVESYESSSLAGKNQSIKAAIDSLNSGLTNNRFHYYHYTKAYGSITLPLNATNGGFLFVLQSSSAYGIYQISGGSGTISNIMGSNIITVTKNGTAITLSDFTTQGCDIQAMGF